MLLVRLGPHVSNPFFRASRAGWPERSLAFRAGMPSLYTGNVTCATTRLVINCCKCSSIVICSQVIDKTAAHPNCPLQSS